MAGEQLIKPEVGQFVYLKPAFVRDAGLGHGRWQVRAVYESLDQDWGDNGEMAWPMYDVMEDAFGENWRDKAEDMWFAVVVLPGSTRNHNVFASFEIERVE